MGVIQLLNKKNNYKEHAFNIPCTKNTKHKNKKKNSSEE